MAIAVPPSPRARLTKLGWLILSLATLLSATFLLPHWQQTPMAGALGLTLFGSIALARWQAPRSLPQIEASWILPLSAHALDEVTVAASLVAPGGAPPLALEAWRSGQQKFEIVALLSSLNSQPTRPAWNTYFPKRGLNPLPPFTVCSSHPFGLISSRAQIGVPSQFIAFPALGVVNPSFTTKVQTWQEIQAVSTNSGDDEFSHLREYRIGDHPHSVHWKASARSQSILVIERQATRCRRLALVVDTTAGAPGWKLERLLSVAATLIDYFLAGGWTITLYGHFAPAGIESDRSQLMGALALAAPQPGDLLALIPTTPSTLVLALNPLATNELTPQPLVLTLADCETFVSLPKLVR